MCLRGITLFIALNLVILIIVSCGSDPIRLEGLERGTIHLDPNPDNINAPWAVIGVNRFAASGNGDSTLASLEIGVYRVIGGAVSGYIMPQPDTQTLLADEMITFAGTYVDSAGGDISPILVVSPTELSFGTEQDEVTISIANGGSGILNWEIIDSPTWLTVNPDDGSTTTELDEVTVAVIRPELSQEGYSFSGTISVIPAIGERQFVNVQMTSSDGFEAIHDDEFYQDRYGKLAAPIRLSYQTIEPSSSPQMDLNDTELMTQKAGEWAVYMYEHIQMAGGGGCGRFVNFAYEVAYREVVLGVPFEPNPSYDTLVYVPDDVPLMIWSEPAIGSDFPPFGARLCYSRDDGISLGHYDLHAEPGYAIGKSGSGMSAIYRRAMPWSYGYIGYCTPLFRYSWSVVVNVRATDGSEFCPVIHWSNPHAMYPGIGTGIPIEQGATIRLTASALPGWEIVTGETTELTCTSNWDVNVFVKQVH